ncbi:hypothetical protein ACWC09_28635 [Streptomyces sp. NPDC001617]
MTCTISAPVVVSPQTADHGSGLLGVEDEAEDADRRQADRARHELQPRESSRS